MTLPVKSQPDPQLGWEGRARIALGTGRRQFVHVWTAPRSPVARVVVTPLLLLATLLIFAVGLLTLLAFAVAIVIVFLALLVGRPLGAIKGRSRARVPAHRPPNN